MNVTLIGMSGAGKSYIGREFAVTYGYDFFDADEYTEAVFSKPLPQVLDECGDETFLEIQERQILDLGRINDTVISPGGSIVYSLRAMDYLRNLSTIVFLDVPFPIIKERIANEDRGIVRLGNQTLEEVYEERRPLYEDFAHVTFVPVEYDTVELLAKIREAVSTRA